MAEKEYIECEKACSAMPDDYYGWRDKKLLKSIPAADVRPRWIPVTERLPEIRKVVLITDGIDVGTGWMNQGWWNTPFADIQRDAVTHWMPLPEPPKEG